MKPTAMIDLSDGLSSDMLHICKQSGVGCEINSSEIPLSTDVYDTALQMNLDAVMCALNGGEDYELLFTIDEKDESKIAGENTFTVIGQITKKENGCLLISKSGSRNPLKAQGWEHFK